MRRLWADMYVWPEVPSSIRKKRREQYDSLIFKLEHGEDCDVSTLCSDSNPTQPASGE